MENHIYFSPKQSNIWCTNQLDVCIKASYMYFEVEFFLLNMIIMLCNGLHSNIRINTFIWQNHKINNYKTKRWKVLSICIACIMTLDNNIAGHYNGVSIKIAKTNVLSLCMWTIFHPHTISLITHFALITMLDANNWRHLFNTYSPGIVGRI